MTLEQIPYLGEILSLTCAVVWAYAVILFKISGDSVHPIGLNSFKNVMAAVLFLPTMWLFGQSLWDSSVSLNDYAIIYLSGALGIGIADTFFFQCLNRVGASVTAIIDCFYSPSVVFFSYLWLDETLTVLQLIGVMLIISAVITATYRPGAKPTNRKTMIIGIAYGIAAMLLMALGVVIVKPVLDRQPLLWVTEHRVIGGIIVLILVLIFHKDRRPIMKSVMSINNRKSMIWGSFIGAYLSMILWLGGIKFTKASIASALNQTTNIFIFIFAALILKEAINSRKIIGIIFAVCGALLLTFG